jgi:hypothetical protein
VRVWLRSGAGDKNAKTTGDDQDDAAAVGELHNNCTESFAVVVPCRCCLGPFGSSWWGEVLRGVHKTK